MECHVNFVLTSTREIQRLQHDIVIKKYSHVDLQNERLRKITPAKLRQWNFQTINL